MAPGLKFAARPEDEKNKSIHGYNDISLNSGST